VSFDPSLRQRIQVVPVQLYPSKDFSNLELLMEWKRSEKGKIAECTISNYEHQIRDAIAWHKDATGREIPVAKWNRTLTWAYLQFVETNYCTNYQPLTSPRLGSMCRANVWVGIIPPQQALQDHCKADCPLFKRPGIDHRINALVRWFRYLVRHGHVETNYVLDIRNEHGQDTPKVPQGERRRNPAIEEARRLVNGTFHPRNRAYYAGSLKWWTRPNEILRLDRYASLGLPTPAHLRPPFGFEKGFPMHPEVKSFEEGGQLLYIPEKRDAANNPVPEKRHGNRWLVVDAELRPILEQYLAWWEEHVERDAEGRPTHSYLWIGVEGRLLEQESVPELLYYRDCERLGLMLPGDRDDPLRRWTGHCDRHFGQQVNQTSGIRSNAGTRQTVPDNWNHHFRGDKIKSAIDKYYQPPPLDVLDAYHTFIPPMGFLPLPDAPRLHASHALRVASPA
jgi:hypothetical protein